MNRIEDEPISPIAATVAWRILDTIGHSPEMRDPDVLGHVARFLENTGALFAFAAREGLCLEWGPMRRRGPNENLQFYFDLSRDGHDLSYLSRGWDDPGVRIGDILRVRGGRRAAFRANLGEVAEACVSQGVSFQVHEGKDGTLDIDLWTPVYGDIVTPKDLAQALDSLEICKRRIEQAVPLDGFSTEET